VLDEMRRLDKRFKIKSNCLEFIKMGRIFGIRHVLFIVDGINYEAPFNPDGVRPGSYRGMTQIDPYWISPVLDSVAAGNPAAPDFYDPTWWQVNGRRVHKSHFVIMRNGEQVPDILKPSYMYGGIPTPQKIFERVYAAERTANEAPMLAMSKRMTTLKVDISQSMADPAKFNAKMEEWAAYQNNFGIKVHGEGEEVNQFDTTLNALDETIMTQYQLVAAAAEVPATKLLGTTPKGFNATGEYDTESYHESLESIQENELTPLIERHNLLVQRSIIQPKFGLVIENSEVTWKPVDTPTAIEQADINLKKAQTDTALATAGAIDGFDVRQRIIMDPDSGYSGIDPVVDGGPGDREAEQEAKELETELLIQGANADAEKGENDKAPDKKEG
jgi:phage-related protein (TIGR01555 family)